ncbi:dynein light chain [Acrasis kona]|uniref:Dynein light chain n=1 Tax=Acrasis kona TaxID=1008807 RepID=A0AAW2Z7G8_9EUKA
MSGQINLEKIRHTYEKYDKDGSGFVTLSELVPIFLELGQSKTEADLFQLLNDTYEDSYETNKSLDADKFESSNIPFHVFLRMLEYHNREVDEQNKENNFINTFTSFGGNRDKTGRIPFDQIKKTCEKFELTVDIQALAKKSDIDSNGTIDYQEFRRILSDRIHQ